MSARAGTNAIRAVAATSAAILVALVPAAVPSSAASGPRITVGTSGIGFFSFGIPGATLSIHGSGFSPGGMLEFFFDSADLERRAADTSGSFDDVRIGVPVSAAPGAHWVSVTEPATGRAAQASFLVETAWVQARYGGTLTGFSPIENVLDPFTVDTLHERWRGTTDGPVRSAPVTSAFGWVYATSNDGAIHAFAPGCTGTCGARWTWRASAPVSGPTLGSGVGFAGSGDGVYAFDPGGCGAPKECPRSWLGQTAGAVTGPPTVGSSVFAGGSDGRVYAFDPAGCGNPVCQPRWVTAAGGAIAGSPAYGYGLVFAASSDGTLRAFDPASGTSAWTYDAGAPITTGLTVSQLPWYKPVVYAGSGSSLVAVNALTGSIIWSGALPAPATAAPSSAYGLVYVATANDELSAFSMIPCGQPTCQPAWTVNTGGAVVGAPAIADGVLSVGARDGSVRLFNALNGAALWSTTLGAAVLAPPSVASEVLYVGAEDRSVHAFELMHPVTPPPRPDPANLVPLATPIRHIVVVYQENHAFDEVLGAMCIADHRCDASDSATLPDGSTIPLADAPDLIPEVDHSIQGQRTAVHGGRMDGFGLLDGCTESEGYACLVHYQPEQIPTLTSLARSFVVSDRTFETDSVPSWGAHYGLVAQLDGFLGDNPAPGVGMQQGVPTWGCDSNNDAVWKRSAGRVVREPSCVPKRDGSGPYRPSPVPWTPTMMDRLDAAGYTWRIDSGWGGWSSCPTFADCIYGPQRNLAVASNQILADAHDGSLPSISYVMPNGPNSQHNGWSMLQGDDWIGRIVGSIMAGPEWDSTAIFITYDDCGCFYDHLPPPPGLGIRVPMVIVSPYAKAGYTDHTVASYASMLAYAEHVLGVQPVGSDDAAAYDFAASFDYSQAPLLPMRLIQHPIPKWERERLARDPPEMDWT